MSVRPSFPVALGLLACLAGPAVAAQPSPPPPKTAAPDLVAMAPMAFFAAHGEANACGPGCSEWIAAVGRIEPDTASRLERLLAELNGARPPLFFHSPGGSVGGAMALGKLLRERKLTVSIGHTILLNCARDPASQKSCIAQIGAHRRVGAELDAATGLCNSACGYALAGGAVRLIPPWVSLGIHDMSLDPASAARNSPLANELGELAVTVRLRNYLRQMGIDDRLLTEASAIPSTTVVRLSRDDAARFGVDRRAFGETEWTFVKTPGPAIRKSFFLRTTTDKPHYINGLVNLSCMKDTPGSYVVAYARERLPGDTAAPAPGPAPPITIGLNEKPVAFYPVTNDKLYIRTARLSAAAMDGIADGATIVLPGAEFGRPSGPAGDITLPLAGFAAAYAKMPDACAQAVATMQSAYVAQSPGAWPSPPVASPQLTAVNSAVFAPLPARELKPGARRAAVDATIGAPTKMVGSTALYSYTSSGDERKVMARYFDKSGRLQRFARYVLKDGNIVDEISNTELSQAQELVAVRALLTGPKPAGSGITMPATVLALPR